MASRVLSQEEKIAAWEARKHEKENEMVHTFSYSRRIVLRGGVCKDTKVT